MKSSLWINHNFMFIWFGNILYNFGFQIYIISLPLFINHSTGSALAMSTIRAIDILPSILAGIFGGVIIDRVNRKKMMILTTLIQFLVLLSIIALVFMNEVEVWQLYILVFFLSLGGYTFWSSHTSALPQILTKEQLMDANSIISLTSTLITMIAPGFAGFIIASYSYITSLSIFLFCLLGVLVFTLFVKIPDQRVNSHKERNSFWNDLKEGFYVLYSEKYIMTPTIAILIKNFANSLIIGIILFYAANGLGANEKQIGLIFSIAALGGLISSLVTPRLRKFLPRGKIFLHSILIDVIGMIGVTLSSNWWMMAISFFIRSSGVTMSNIVYSTIRQEVTPNHLLGRVAGTSSMLMKLTMPLGLLVSGIWAEFLPIKYLFVIATVVIATLYLALRKHSFVKVN
ncbi:MFS transporter [Paenibacillus aceti]|nr:MFS transporter [Paenibacillus aceti]